MREQFGRRRNNVGIAHSLINILKNFRFNGINLDYIFHYQLTLLYQPHIPSPLCHTKSINTVKWLSQIFWMATACKIHIVPHNWVLRVLSLSRKPIANYDFHPYQETSSEPASLLGACNVIGYNWHHLLASRACILSLRKILVTIMVSMAANTFRIQRTNGELMLAVITLFYVLWSFQ